MPDQPPPPAHPPDPAAALSRPGGAAEAVRLRRGENRLLFAGNRYGVLRARFHAATAPLQFIQVTNSPVYGHVLQADAAGNGRRQSAGSHGEKHDDER